MPDYIHSTIQALLAFVFGPLRQTHHLLACCESRLKRAPDVYRIPDLSVLTQAPEGRIPDRPPLAAIEILSNDDRHSGLMQKLEEYRAWGIPNIWVIDPMTKRFSIYTGLGLQNVSTFVLPGYPFQLTPADLFSQL